MGYVKIGWLLLRNVFQNGTGYRIRKVIGLWFIDRTDDRNHDVINIYFIYY